MVLVAVGVAVVDLGGREKGEGGEVGVAGVGRRAVMVSVGVGNVTTRKQGQEEGRIFRRGKGRRRGGWDVVERGGRRGRGRRRDVATLASVLDVSMRLMEGWIGPRSATVHQNVIVVVVVVVAVVIVVVALSSKDPSVVAAGVGVVVVAAALAVVEGEKGVRMGTLDVEGVTGTRVGRRGRRRRERDGRGRGAEEAPRRGGDGEGELGFERRRSAVRRRRRRRRRRRGGRRDGRDKGRAGRLRLR